MTIRIILGIVIIAAVIEAGVFISGYFNQSFAAEAITSQIESENQNMAILLNKTRMLNSEIAENTTSVNNLAAIIDLENNKLPDTTINPNEIVRALLSLGQNNHVSVIPLTTQDWSRVTTGNPQYQILKMSVVVAGSTENIVRFVNQLPGLYNTLVIENLSMTAAKQIGISQTNTYPVDVPLSDTEMSANLSLAVYAK